MTVSVIYNEEQYELPYSMGCLNEYQDYAGWHLKLSHLKFVNISTDENPYLRYKLFVGVMPTTGNTRIIIYGEYFDGRPYSYGSFNYIEVNESEFIEFDDQSSKFILDVGNNSCAILLKSKIIVIGITPDFQDFLHEDENTIEVDEYEEDYLFIKRIDFIRDITNLTFDRSSIDGRPSFDERMTSRVEKDGGDCKIVLHFTCVCRSSKKIHSETTNEITISFSNEQIRITYAMNTTTYERYMLDATGYNDFPTILTDERNAEFYREITYDRFSEEDD